MKQLTIILLGLFSVAYGQFAPTSAKQAFKWGVSIGTRDSTAYGANDSLIVVINRQGRMMYRSTDGYWKVLANAASSDFVPYTGAITNVNLGNFRLSARSLRMDSVIANGSGGAVFATNSGNTAFSYGAGGGSEVTFNGFAGYNANRSSSYTVRSFTDKNYVDSSIGVVGLQKVTSIDSVTTNEIIMPRMTVDTVGGVAYNSPWRAIGVKTNINGVSHWHGVTNGSGIGGGDLTFHKTRPSGQPLQLNDQVWYSEWRARFRTGENWELSDTAKIFDDVVTIGNTSLANRPGGLRRFRSVYNGSTVTALSINHLGQVGIRRDNPSFDLDINGTLRSVGNAQFANATIGTGSGSPAYVLNGGTVNGTGGAYIGRRGGTDIYYLGSSSWISSGGDNSNNAAIWALANFRIYANNSTAAANTFSFSSTGFSLSNGITGRRANLTSLVLNKDSIPITTSNLWAATLDTTTGRLQRREISSVHTGAIAFDTTTRALTINQIGGGTTSVVIPRGGSGGGSGILALSSSRTGNLVTVSGDNGSTTTFSIRDADSTTRANLIPSYGISGSSYNGVTERTWAVDTTQISTKANVTALVGGYMDLSSNQTASGIKTFSGGASSNSTFNVSIGTDYTFMGALNFAFNRNTLTGAIGNTNGYAYQWQKTNSLTPANDFLSLQVYTPLGASVTANAISVNGLGNTSLSGTLSGTSGTFSSSVTASSFIRSGGLSSQFLKADGSVDGSTYLTASDISGKLNISDTSLMLSPYRRTTTKIQNIDLANSTISGVALGSNLNDISPGNGISGSPYNGNGARTWSIDTGRAAEKIVTGGSLNKVKDSITATTVNLSGNQTVAGEKNFTSAATFSGGVNGTTLAMTGATQLATSSGRVLIKTTTDNTVDALQVNGSGSFNGNLSSTGILSGVGFKQPITLKTTNYTLTTNDHTVIFDCAAANRTVALPVGVEGQIFVIKAKNASTNGAIITPNGSQTIEGNSTYTLSNTCGDAAITIQFFSGNWEIISSYIPPCL